MCSREAKGRGAEYFGYYFCRRRQEKACDLRHLPAREVERAVAREVKWQAITDDSAEVVRDHVLREADAQQSAKLARTEAEVREHADYVLA